MNATNDIRTHADEIASGDRFSFGENWKQFLSVLDETRITRAVDSLKEMLRIPDLAGKTFVDIGSGSGLFSLAARRLGARVLSLDYDPQSVACTNELRRRYFPDDADWAVLTGSVLDAPFIRSLGKFDVVYSWGVLHHTGDMWTALANVSALVADRGLLFIALYNDQGGASRRWRWIKRNYNRLPTFLRFPFAAIVYAPIELRHLIAELLRGSPGNYGRYIRDYRKNRGMSWWHDKIDWIGGYPFEVSTPHEIFNYHTRLGYRLVSLNTVGGHLGCNEFVFRKDP